jgi:hypothetical protein
MAKKLILVQFSARIEIEVPEGITDEMIFEADERRIGASPEVEKACITALKDAYDAIGWRDGEITDIQDGDE